MNFLEHIDNTYNEVRDKLNIDVSNKEFSCFISIEPLDYSTKNKFLIKKQKHSKLFIIKGNQRVYLSDIDIQFCNLYVTDNNSCSFKIAEKNFSNSGIEYFSAEKDILLYTDSVISINDFIFIINFVLSKDSIWGIMNKLVNFRKLTLCKYISILKYYSFKSESAKEFLKEIGYPVKNATPIDSKSISELFNNDIIEKFDISLFV